MEKILNSIEARVIGSLIEKELTTPEYYPLTLNSLVNACNQKSNRDPVVSYDSNVVEKALNSLRDKQFVRRVTGNDMRVPKYKQIFTEELKFSPGETAIICMLMLRGPQTVGELKGRTGRMFNFESLSGVEEVINVLAGREEPLVFKLPRQAGMKESRYVHLLSGQPDLNVEPESAEPVNKDDERLTMLELEISSVKEELADLKNQFMEIKKLLE
jgi:hypothetical protein